VAATVIIFLKGRESYLKAEKCGLEKKGLKIY
jgi:hypothetical protein